MAIFAAKIHRWKYHTKTLSVADKSGLSQPGSETRSQDAYCANFAVALLVKRVKVVARRSIIFLVFLT